jgi:hypothetical protein
LQQVVGAALATRHPELARLIVQGPAAGQSQDQAISLDEEFLLALDGLLDTDFATGSLGIYGPGRALPSMIDRAANLKVPILILQEENDATTAAKDARLLQ